MTASICPLVIDADALTILSRNMHLLEKQDRSVILTPHIGEFKRLCHVEDYPDLMLAAQSFASQYHCILVLKGPHTIVITLLSDGMKIAICMITLLLLFLIRFVNHYMLRRKQKRVCCPVHYGNGTKNHWQDFLCRNTDYGYVFHLIGIFCGVFCSQFITAMLLTAYGKAL